jgi:hypothetical protein
MIIRLFYSTKCEECMNLWQVIKNENITKMFTPVCIDTFNSKQLETIAIKLVPAIVISSENQPSSIFEGTMKCSQWLTSFTINRRRNLALQVNEQRKLIQKAQAQDRIQNEGALEYNEAEMEGISDSYSYNNIELYQPKNFVTVGNEDHAKIVTLHTKTQENKVTTDTLKRSLDELKLTRNKEDTQFMSIMEQNQIKSVLNSNNPIF